MILGGELANNRLWMQSGNSAECGRPPKLRESLMQLQAAEIMSIKWRTQDVEVPMAVGERLRHGRHVGLRGHVRSQEWPCEIRDFRQKGQSWCMLADCWEFWLPRVTFYQTLTARALEGSTDDVNRVCANRRATTSMIFGGRIHDALAFLFFFQRNKAAEYPLAMIGFLKMRTLF
jgi:hypothetical protein